MTILRIFLIVLTGLLLASAAYHWLRAYRDHRRRVKVLAELIEASKQAPVVFVRDYRDVQAAKRQLEADGVDLDGLLLNRRAQERTH